MSRRAAIVIGVNKSGDLTPLKAAITGAREVGKWLENDGFEVKVLTDEKKPLGASEIKKAVRRILDGRPCEKLVVYFAGHGYLNGTSEIWLLSNAPDDPNEAIDQSLSAEFARSCGIRSVIFISDACRSVPQTFAANRVSGVSIFPNRQVPVDVEIDRFFATRPGDAALEITETEASKRYVGLFTETLKNCHVNPPRDLIANAVIEGQPAAVVPCRRLKETLPRLVDDAAQERSILLTQLPQLRLECGDDAFLARALIRKAVGPGLGSTHRGGGLIRPRRVQHSPSPQDPDQLYYSPDVQDALSSPQFRGDINRFLASQDIEDPTLRTGLQIMGKPVARILADGLSHRRNEQERYVAHFDLSGTKEAARSVIVEFDDGSGGMIAILRNYVATVVADNNGIQNISYVPGHGSARRLEYERQRQRTEKLRSIAAAAAKSGILAVDRQDAKQFGDLVRVAKRWDPTLGLYAALAYAEVGLRDEVRSVAEYMWRDLKIEFFDIALLAGMKSKSLNVFPLCPALNQTWMYLTARGHRLPDELERAGHHRMPATWTTFDAEGMALLKEVF